MMNNFIGLGQVACNIPDNPNSRLSAKIPADDTARKDAGDLPPPEDGQ
jgi:hypothetical protein